MADDRPSWGEGWSAGLRVWVERAGQAILGEGRLELLEGIERWGSITQAARHAGISYRHAWLTVQSINNAAREPLVEAATGGTGGGGASLTVRGKWAVAVFREFQDRLRLTAAGLLTRLIQPPQAPSVHVAAAVSLEDVLGQVLADFALVRPGVRVRTVFGASDELADQLLGGAPADLFLTADPHQLDRLRAAGLLKARSRADLAENGLAAIGLAERSIPIRRPADLARPEVARVALAEPSSPLGVYTRAYLEGLGLYDALLARRLPADNARAVVAAVRSGGADAGIVYRSDAVRAAGCRLLFQAGRPGILIRYAGAVLARSLQPEQALDLLHFLRSSPAVERFRSCGFKPLTGKRRAHRPE
jgi:molybdate transport system substrate-binding protein